jgi:hypothetical protein
MQDRLQLVKSMLAAEAGRDWPRRPDAIPITARDVGAKDPKSLRYPPGYVALKGGTFRVKPDPDGEGNDEYVFLTSAIFLDFTATHDADEGEVVHARIVFPREPVSRARVFRTTTKRIGTMKLGEDLGSAGVIVLSGRRGSELMELTIFMRTFLDEIRAAGEVRAKSESFGWVDQGDQWGFSLSGKVIWSDGSETENFIPAQAIEDIYRPKGALDRWRSSVQPILDQNRQPVNAMVASAFAAPLVTMTGVSGCVLSLVSRASGTGKTTAMRAAQSVWGCPQRGIFRVDDTGNAIVKTLESLAHLPAYWDELRMAHVIQTFIGVLFSVTQGRGKARLNSNAESKRVGSWQTLIACGSNESLLAHVAQLVDNSDAGVRRIFELTLLDKPVRGGFDVNLVAEHYGVAGVDYAKFLAANRDDVRAFVKETYDEFDAGTDSADRFWVATVASLYAGAALASKCGLLNFDLDALKTYLRGELKRHRLRLQADAADVNDHLREFINSAHTRNKLVMTDSINWPTRGGRPKTLHIKMPIGDFAMSFRGPPEVQIAVEDRVIAVDRKQLKTHLRHLNVLEASVVESMVADGWIEDRTTLVMGAPPEYANLRGRTRTSVLYTDIDNPNLHGLLDDIDALGEYAKDKDVYDA